MTLAPPKTHDPMADTWDRYAEVYDLVYGPGEPRRLAEELPFLEFAFATLARRPVREIHDLSAGTGAQAVALAQSGYAVTACDPSGAMLARCAERARAAGIALTGIARRSIEETTGDGLCDAAIACFGTVGLILDEPDLDAALCRVLGLLRPGGIFVFDYINLLEEAAAGVPELAHNAGQNGDVSHVSMMTSRVDTFDAIVDFRDRVVLTSPNGERVVEVALRMRGWNRHELERAARRAGFAEVLAFRGYGDRGASREPHVFRPVLVCRKDAC